MVLRKPKYLLCAIDKASLSPYFFEIEDGITITLKGYIYPIMIIDLFIPLFILLIWSMFDFKRTVQLNACHMSQWNYCVKPFYLSLNYLKWWWPIGHRWTLEEKVVWWQTRDYWECKGQHSWCHGRDTTAYTEICWEVITEEIVFIFYFWCLIWTKTERMVMWP